jgi:hypothetical protein
MELLFSFLNYVMVHGYNLTERVSLNSFLSTPSPPNIHTFLFPKAYPINILLCYQLKVYFLFFPALWTNPAEEYNAQSLSDSCDDIDNTFLSVQG